MAEIYFEDVEIGRTEEYGTTTVTREAIIEFARAFDPQPFHLNDEAARQSLFGRLAASGWHTASMMMRLLVDHRIGRSASLGSPGFDDLRWQQPVHAGDTLRVRSTCTRKRPSRSQPNMGSLWYAVEVLNQNDEVVMSVTTIELLARRAPAPADEAHDS